MLDIEQGAGDAATVTMSSPWYVCRLAIAQPLLVFQVHTILAGLFDWHLA